MPARGEPFPTEPPHKRRSDLRCPWCDRTALRIAVVTHAVDGASPPYWKYSCPACSYAELHAHPIRSAT